MYISKINRILEKNMSNEGYTLWSTLCEKIPPIWNRLSSSTKKFHKKEGGRVPTIGEHTYEMLFAAEKMIKLFGIKPKTRDADVLYLAIALHDSYKYGINPQGRRFTDTKHEKIIADKVKANRDKFKRIMDDEQVTTLEEALRYHSGIWSPDAKKDKSFSLDNLRPESFFVHLLDMFSSRNLIKMPEES